MLRRVLVGDNERVLLIRKKRFNDILVPGEYWIFTLGRGVELERHNIKDLVFAGERADYIVREQPELASRYFTVVDTADSQVAVVYLNGKLARVVKPGNRVLFWRGAVAVTFDLIDVRKEPEGPERLVAAPARIGPHSA